MAKLWCKVPTHPTVVAVANKYNITKKQAKTVINNAAEEDPTLQEDNITLKDLEENETFREHLAAFVGRTLETGDLLGVNKPSEKNKYADIKAAFPGMTDEQIEEILGRKDLVKSDKRIGRVSTVTQFKILNAFSNPSKLNFIGDWLCRYMSEQITMVTSSKQIRNKWSIETKTTRQDYFKDARTMNMIYFKMRKILEVLAKNSQDEQARKELLTVRENLPAVMFMYGSTLFRLEGVNITLDNMPKTSGVSNQDLSRNASDENAEAEMTELEEGNGSVNGFSVSDQDKSISTKIVEDIKIMLGSLKDIRTSGKSINDPYGYGFWTYVSPAKATNVILSLTRNCTTFEEMDAALAKNVHTNPWLVQLRAYLHEQRGEDGSVKNSSRKEQLRTMFFKSFRKQGTNFSTTYTTYDANGRLILMTRGVNSRHMAEVLMSSVFRTFANMYGIEIVDNGSINVEKLEALANRISTKYDSPLKLAILNAFSKINTTEDPGITGTTEAVTMLLNAAKGLGFTKLTRAMVEQTLFNGAHSSNPEDMQQSFITRGLQLATLLSNIADKLVKWQEMIENEEIADTPATNPLSKQSEFPKEDKTELRRAYQRAADLLTEFCPDSFEQMSYEGGKSYYAENNPSTIQTIVEGLRNPDREKRGEYIQKHFGKDTLWFVKDVITGLEGTSNVFYADVLNDLTDDNIERGLFNYREKVTVNGNKPNDINRRDFYLSMLSSYFTPAGFTREMAWYKTPPASNKPRYPEIKLFRYSNQGNAHNSPGEDYRAVITKKARDFFTQELKRAKDVVLRARTPGITTIDNYDITGKKSKDTFEKIKKGEKITRKDLVVDGKYIFANTGASFFFNKFLNKEIISGSALGNFIIDAVFNNGSTEFSNKLLESFDNGFAEYMTSIKKHGIKELESAGIFTGVTKEEFGELGKYKITHAKYLEGNLALWNQDDMEWYRVSLEGYTDAAKKRANDEGISDEDFYNEGMLPYFQERLLFEEMYEEYVYNNWLAKATMLQIIDVDPAFYGGTPNYQKRNAQMLSSGYPMDPNATIHGKRVSDDKYRSITVLTDKKESAYKSNVERALWREAEKMPEGKEKEAFIASIQTISSALSAVDPTDGQGLTGLTALRKRLIHAGEWSRSETEKEDKLGYVEDETGNRTLIMTDEAIYQRFLRGQATRSDLQHVFAQPQKPFVYSDTNMSSPGGRTLTVPIQHKNSEYAAIYASAFEEQIKRKGLTQEEEDKLYAEQSTQEAISRFLEYSAKVMPNRGIDTVNFDSAVKIGGNSRVIDLRGLNGKEAFDALVAATIKKDTHGKSVSYSYIEGAVTEYDITDYKIQQVIPEHLRASSQPIGSQIKVLSVNNIPDNAKITIRDKNGNTRTITGKEAKELYLKTLAKKTQKIKEAFESEMGLNLTHADRMYRMSNYLKNILGKDARTDSELLSALSIVEGENGPEFAMPLDDTASQKQVEATLLSQIRKIFFKQKMNGGAVVQATSWGKKKDLRIRFYSSSEDDIANNDGFLLTKKEFKAKTGYTGETLNDAYDNYCKTYQGDFAYFECELPMTDRIREKIIAAAKKRGSMKDFIDIDGNWNMEEIKKVVPESELDAIAYRIPTESKYSTMPCKVVGFTNDNSGNVAFYPEEITVFTGSDFDIDKTFIEFRPIKGDDYYEEDETLFEIQYGMLSSGDGIKEMFKPGDFSDLSEQSYYITLAMHGYKKEQLDKMSFKELKEACSEVEDLDLMDPSTDEILHYQNSDAGEMVGIAAVGVTSHAFMSLYNDPENDIEESIRVNFSKGSDKTTSSYFRFINDLDTSKKKLKGKNIKAKDFKEDVIIDGVYDMDGNLIGSQISKYVGGSTDAGKDSALNRLNITRQTLPILVMLHRLGVSSFAARLFISHPVVREVVQQMQISEGGYDISSAIEEVQDIISEKAQLSEDEMNGILSEFLAKEKVTEIKASTLLDTFFNYKTVYDITTKAEATEYLKVLHVLEIVASKQQAVRASDGFLRYNSSKTMQGSSVLSRYSKRTAMKRLFANLDREGTLKLPAHIKNLMTGEELDPDTPAYIKFCHMYPHIATTIFAEDELEDLFIFENMRTYSPAILELIRNYGGLSSDSKIEEVADVIYNAWKTFNMFVRQNRIADFTKRDTVLRYTKYFGNIFNKTIDDIQEAHPKVYEEYIENNPFIDAIGYKDETIGNDTVLLMNAKMSGADSDTVAAFKSGWVRLLENKYTRQLAIDAAIHFLTRNNGVAFSATTPAHLIPSAIKRAIPNYTKVFTDIDKLPLSEEDMWKFQTLLALNNLENKSIVPTVYNSPRSIKAYEKDGSLVITERGMGYIDYMFETVKDSIGGKTITARRPVLKVGNQAYLITDRKVTIRGEKGNLEYVIAGAVQIDPLGITGKFQEYTGLPVDRSVFGEQPKDDADRAEQNSRGGIQTIPDVKVTASGLQKGNRSGSFTTAAPLSAAGIDTTDSIDKKLSEALNAQNGYMESREFLHRAMRVARDLGVDVTQETRAEALDTYDPDNTPYESVYTLALDAGRIPSLAGRHSLTKMLAAVSSSLGIGQSFNPIAKTYSVEWTPECNSIEFVINLADDVDINTVRDSWKWGLFGEDSVLINEDKREIQISARLNPATDSSDIKAVSKEFSAVAKEVSALHKELKAAGFASKDNVEFNYAIVSELDSTERKELLKDIINGQAETLLGTRTTGRILNEDPTVVRTGIRGKERLRNIASKALAKENGERVTQEQLDEALGYTQSPITSASGSALASTIQNQETKGTVLSDLVNAITGNAKTEDAASPDNIADALVANVYNIIIRHADPEALRLGLAQYGVNEKTADDFVQSIKEKMEELNIC